mmetsp:Transcript_1715/g.3914  ORF Transcript_1715/g.3914 Transcript_1715/m.3914 type:complete len:333 (-) Transcript_1715:2600-3598(-)
MAARKSCTKLTWSEAKNKVGESSGGQGKKKPNGLVGTKNHATHQAQKIISKGDNRSQSDKIKDRQAARLARKDAERQAYLNAQREEEKERAQLEQLVRPYDLAVERLDNIANDEQDNNINRKAKSSTTTDDPNNTLADLDLDQVCECRQMQLDEILALEAIYDGADMEPLSFLTASKLEDHRKTIEEWQLDESNEELKKTVRDLPPISFTLKLILENDGDDVSNNGPSLELLASESELACLMLLKVTFPPLYPLYEGQTPYFEVVDFMVVDKTSVCNKNKPLESIGRLQEDEFIEALKSQALELHGMPCVYEIVATWLPEEGNIFSSFIILN